MIRSIRCDVATSAFFFPLRAANDQYFAANHLFRHLDTAQAASHMADLICGFPFTVLVLYRFPALSLFPGHSIREGKVSGSLIMGKLGSYVLHIQYSSHSLSSDRCRFDYLPSFPCALFVIACSTLNFERIIKNTVYYYFF